MNYDIRAAMRSASFDGFMRDEIYCLCILYDADIQIYHDNRKLNFLIT